MEWVRRASPGIAILFRVYAKVLAQTQHRANQRIEAALQEWGDFPPSPGGRLGDMRRSEPGFQRDKMRQVLIFRP